MSKIKRVRVEYNGEYIPVSKLSGKGPYKVICGEEELIRGSREFIINNLRPLSPSSRLTYIVEDISSEGGAK